MEKKITITKDDHSDAKALNKLTEKLINLPKQSNLEMSPKLRSQNENYTKLPDKSPRTTPLARRLRKRKLKPSDHPKIDNYLREKGCLPLENKNQDKGKKQPNSSKYKPLAAATKTTKSKENLKTNGSNKRKNNNSSSEQSSLDTFFNKPAIKNRKKGEKSKSETSFKRSESSDSCELPTFKTSKKPVRKKKEKSSYKRYGISTPSVDEILQDKVDLEKHRNQMEAFQLQPLCNTSFELPFSAKDFDDDRTPEIYKNVLDCKSLSLSDLTESFENNRNHLSDIINGKVYNERHERYHDKNNKLFTLTPRDLSYSTSMIVFSFEQTEHMLSLLKKEFDPADDKTRYFFQVLLPELCLRIFMEAHQMSLEEAVIYLEERPPVGD